jgi:hypothetical protein
MTEPKGQLLVEIRKILSSVGLTVGLVCFLVGMRMVRNNEEPAVTLRTLSTALPVSLPTPPPPPPDSEPPPPSPPPPDLPHLKIELDSVAPAVKASL